MSRVSTEERERLADALLLAWRCTRRISLRDLPADIRQEIPSMEQLCDEILEASKALRCGHLTKDDPS